MRLHLPKSLLAAVLALSALPGLGAVTFDPTSELTKGVGYLLLYDKGVINLTLDSSAFATQSAGTLLVTCKAGTQGGNPIMGVAAAGEGKFETVLNESGSSFTSRETGSSALTGNTVKVSMTSSGVTVTEDITTGEGESATTSTTTLVTDSNLKNTTAPRGYTYTVAENDAITSASLSDGTIIKNLAGSGDLTVDSSFVILEGGGSEEINFSMVGKKLSIAGNVTLNTISTATEAGSDLMVAEGAALTAKKLNFGWNPGNFLINGTLSSVEFELKTNRVSTVTGSGSVTLGSLKTGNGGKLDTSVADFTVTGDIDLGGVNASGGATSDSLTISGGSFTAQGTTTVRSGRTLQLGCTNENSTGVTAAQISMNNLVVLSGGTVNMNYMKGSIASVDLQGGTLHYRDCVTKDADNALGITTLTVSANSSFQKTWKGIVNVAELTGSGNLSITDRESTNDPFNLNVSKLHNYTGTISKTSSTTTLTISSVEQDAGNEGTVSSAVTLASGFTKTGEGAITFTGTTGISVADVSAGALKFDGSLTTLNDTLTISGGVAENTATGDNTEIRLGTAGKVSIVSGSLINDGFTYSNNGADASITGNGQSTLKVYEGRVVLKDVAMEKTVSADKGIGIEMDNVSLIVNAGTTTLRKDGEGKTQSLSSVSVGNGATLKVENTKAAISNASGTGIISTTVAHTLSLNTESGKEFTGTLEASGENGVLSVNGVKELAALKVDGGQVWANTADSAISVSISEVVLAGGMVGVYSAVSVEATVQTGSLTVSGNSTLYANLDLAQDGTLTLNSSLTMGSTLTLNSGITLSGSLLTGWTDRSQALTLFSGVDELVLNGKTATADTTYDASSVFSGMSGYNLVMTDGTGGKDYIVQLVQSTPTPEPTTATLSLLALMGLAARRRRRKA